MKFLIDLMAVLWAIGWLLMVALCIKEFWEYLRD